MKTVLLVVDMQNDFCLPSGSLYVPGAEKDVERLSRLIKEKMTVIDKIILTADEHHVMDIAHPSYWKNKRGEHPAPFTTISWWEVLSGEWIPFGDKDEVIDYLRRLIENEEYKHMIWPEHCLYGSEGAAITPVLMEAVTCWAREGKYYEVVEKGLNPSTEFFGAFRANIPLEGDADTKFNMKLKDELESYDVIWLAGEAKSHCVANTLRQLFDYPEVVRRLVILEDCMSNISGCEDLAIPIYEKAARMGARFAAGKMRRSSALTALRGCVFASIRVAPPNDLGPFSEG